MKKYLTQILKLKKLLYCV